LPRRHVYYTNENALCIIEGRKRKENTHTLQQDAQTDSNRALNIVRIRINLRLNQLQFWPRLGFRLRSRFKRDHTLNTTTLRPPRARAVLICGMRPERPSSLSVGVPATTPCSRLGGDDGNGTKADGDIAGACASFQCLRLFPLLLEDNFVSAIIGATCAEAAPLWNRAFDGGVVSSGVAGTDVDVGSTCSSSSKSPPSVDADAARVKN
jgi:hypothetical protein